MHYWLLFVSFTVIDFVTGNRIAESAIVFQRNTDPFGKLYSTVPLFAKLCPDRSGFTEARNASNKLHLFFKKRIDHYIDTFDDTYDRNFIDMYIRKIKEAEESGDKSTFTCAFTLIDS